MKKNNNKSKQKGREFEREIYKQLRDIEIFKSVKLTLGSGSSDELHDIQADEYTIECKKGKMYNDFKLIRIFDEVTEHCKNPNIPLLIYRQHRKKDMVMMWNKVLGTRTRTIISFTDFLECVKNSDKNSEINGDEKPRQV